ncbi:hypothetical protein BS639_09020 [Rouxiella silvae]|uniref:Uncharacterized protein n=1 Tax=Rouxiella silvae TaxID=1646373 RepID=A0ABX3U2A5_9GAMM|nr:hypothetical protein BS639_09020 [Rouxiella silvae]
MLLAGSIFLLTLVLVIWQPRGLSIGWSASMGSNVRHRLPDRVPVVGDEQYADGADWRAVD